MDSSEPPAEEISMTAFGWKVTIITTLVLLGGVFAGGLRFIFWCLIDLTS